MTPDLGNWADWLAVLPTREEVQEEDPVLRQQLGG